MVHEKKIRGNTILIIKCAFSRTHEVNHSLNGAGDANIVLRFTYRNRVISFYTDVTLSNPKTFFGKSLTPGLIEYYITYEKHVALKWFALLNRQLNVIRPLTEALQLCILHGNHVRKPNQTKNESF